jgi:catalase
MKTRERSESFNDHYSQATLFFRSQSPVEQLHIIKALSFELGKVTRKELRTRMLQHLVQIDEELAAGVATNLGLPVPPASGKLPKPKGKTVEVSPLLSMENPEAKKSLVGPRGDTVAIVVADGMDAAAVTALRDALQKQGVVVDLVGPKLGVFGGVEVEKTFLTSGGSVVYDAVLVAGGKGNAMLAKDGDARTFVLEAFSHCKPLGTFGEGKQLLDAAQVAPDEGVVTASDGKGVLKPFLAAMEQVRFWDREKPAGAILP